MAGTRESDNHDGERQAKRPRLQSGRGRSSGRGRHARVPTDPPPADDQQGEHTNMQTQNNAVHNMSSSTATEPMSADLARYKIWRGEDSSTVRDYRVLTCAI